MSGEIQVDTTRAWLIAIRPHTLPAGAAPVAVGTAVAAAEGVLAIGPALAALVGALLIQIGTNLANDYFDAKSGVDAADREGFTRVTHRGLIPPRRVRLGMIGSFIAAIVVGTYLVWIGGIPIVVIGLVSVLCGVAYAGGPFPFGSYGLGDAFVFLFFGIVAVTGTYYVQAVTALSEAFPLWLPPGIAWELALVASLPMGALTTAILVVNNLRDIHTDRRAGKLTLAVMVGPYWTKAEYIGLLAIAYAVPIGLFHRNSGPIVLLPLVTLPVAIVLASNVLGFEDPDELNRTLSRTGQLLVGYAACFAIGVVIA